MYTLSDIESLKLMGSDSLINQYCENQYNESVNFELPNTAEVSSPVGEGFESIYGRPSIKLNVPLLSDLELNFVPDINDTKDNFTTDLNNTEPVKSDPFDISPIQNPEEDDLDEDEKEDTTPRFMSLQDLM